MTFQELLQHRTSQTSFDTTNGWGFGGGVGTSYKFSNGAEVRTGTAYYKHLPSEPFVCIYNPDGLRIYDATKASKTIDYKFVLELKKEEI